MAIARNNPEQERMAKIILAPSTLKFARNMQIRMDDNTDKKGWKTSIINGKCLIIRLEYNLAIYKDIRNKIVGDIFDGNSNLIYLKSQAEEDLIDIANYAMMLFDQLEEQD